MDFERYEIVHNGIKLIHVKNFDIKQICECGQCFRWNRTESGSYIGTACKRVIEVSQDKDSVTILNTNEDDFKNIWLDYFDLSTDYGLIKDKLKQDTILRKAVEYGSGIRLLKQEPFEIIISFIISSNNRIPMIKKVVDRISQKYGKKIVYKGKEYYTFPDINEIKGAQVQDFKDMSAGFRAEYIDSAVNRINDEKDFISTVVNLEDDLCFEKLNELRGVGPKVADCIMLFSMQKYSAFPVDVWVKRAMQYFYGFPDASLLKIRKFAREKFGNNAGFAQQYLFYYARENKIIV